MFNTPAIHCMVAGGSIASRIMTANPPRVSSSITNGFRAASAYNILGVLAFSKFFTNSLLTSLDPAVFSWLGLVAVILWGCAYGAVARSYYAVPCLLWVFVVEKMIYTGTWVSWLIKHGGTLPRLFSESPLTAAFYASYGAGDFAFGVFFLWVIIRLRASRAETL